jgi:solute carrier family 25 phosphate transporter 3
MVSDPAFAHLSTLGAVALAARREGPLSLFHGLGALLMKQIPYTSVKQVSFDLIARALYSLSAQLHGGSTVRNGGLIALTSAFVTSILSCLASQPGDMVLTAMCQSSHIHQHVHSSACNQLGCDGTSVAAYDQINKIHSASGPAREPVTTQSVNNLSAWRTAINIYKSRGIGGFFIGTQARLLHVVAIVTSQLVIYDAVKRLLGLAATGTH